MADTMSNADGASTTHRHDHRFRLGTTADLHQNAMLGLGLSAVVTEVPKEKKITERERRRRRFEEMNQNRMFAEMAEMEGDDDYEDVAGRRREGIITGGGRRSSSSERRSTKRKSQLELQTQSRENLMGLAHHQAAMDNLRDSVEGHDEHSRRLHVQQLDARMRLAKKLESRARGKQAAATTAGHTLLTRKRGLGFKAGKIMRRQGQMVKRRITKKVRQAEEEREER